MKLKKNLQLSFFILFLIQLTSCTSPYYASEYQGKNLNRFSIPKTNGTKRYFIKKPKQKLNPSYTKYAKDWYGK